VATSKQIALIRAIPATLVACELTHLTRVPIDLSRARQQHAAYAALLKRLGYTLHHLPALDEYPDSVFVEDTMLVLPEVAVALRPGAASRRGEVPTVAHAVSSYRSIVTISAPDTIDGGDLLVLGQSVFVGLGSRSTSGGMLQLRHHLEPYGYAVTGVPMTQCLHLKSAATAIGDDAMLCNPEWVDPGLFAAKTTIECDPKEPHSANVLRIVDELVAGIAPGTNQRLRDAGQCVHEIDLSELAKAEGAVTCCSVLFTSSSVGSSD
jgi:dimethylargininase